MHLPDGDSFDNLAEFALNGDPLVAIADSKIAYRFTILDGEKTMTLTMPVRNGTVFSGTAEQVSADIDGIIYRIRGSTDLTSWMLPVSEVTGGDATAIQAGLPVLSSGWTYRTFRLTDGQNTNPKAFMMMIIEQP